MVQLSRGPAPAVTQEGRLYSESQDTKRARRQASSDVSNSGVLGIADEVNASFSPLSSRHRYNHYSCVERER